MYDNARPARVLKEPIEDDLASGHRLPVFSEVQAHTKNLIFPLDGLLARH